MEETLKSIFSSFEKEQKLIMLDPNKHQYLSEYVESKDINVESMLEMCTLTALICGTGRGKTYLMEEIIKTHSDKNFLFFSPRKKLQNQINKRLNYPNVECLTIQKF